MLLDEWKRRLEAAAGEGREMRLQTRKSKVVVVGVKPGMNQVDLIEFASMAEYMKRVEEIDEFFESKRKD